MNYPCSHGLLATCRACQQIADALEAEFWRGVFLGDWNDRGYTPREWAKYQRKIGAPRGVSA